MKTIYPLLASLISASMLAGEPAADLKSATDKLAQAANYSWSTTSEMGGGGGGQPGGRMGPSTTEGKSVKDGATHLVITRGDTTSEAVLRGAGGAVKTPDGWKSLAEATADDGSGGGQRNPGRWMARTLQNYKKPAQEAAELVSKTKGLKADGDAIVGELTEDGAKSLMMMGRGRGAGGNAPDISGAKGTVKFWLKDGVLAKYQYHVEGKMTVNNNEREFNRTTTVQIKDVGSTKVEVPEAAAPKLS